MMKSIKFQQKFLRFPQWYRTALTDLGEEVDVEAGLSRNTTTWVRQFNADKDLYVCMMGETVTDDE